MAYNADQRRRALKKFMDDNELQPKEWARQSGLSESSLWPFMKGKTHALGDDTYEALASGAAKILRRPVTGGEIRGEKGQVLVPVRSFVGAGDEVVPIAQDEPIDYVPAPPGMEECEATEVRGRSMIPLYHHGDRLFHRRLESNPAAFREEVVVVQVKNGKRYVKLLQAGSRRGRYTLASVNPAFEPMIDQALDWVGPIEWVHKRQRRG